MKVLDLFSGAGGLSLGFKQAGYEIVGAIDFDKYAIETHQLNFKEGKDIFGDIRNISNTVIEENYQDIDVIIGGPPCQGFSSANMWEKDLRNEDERNHLFEEFLRFIELIMPKAFVIENVQGIMTSNKGFVKNEIEKVTRYLGYDTKSSVLMASDYGVPQNRKRAFFVGIREDLKVSFDFNKIEKEEAPTVYDALSDLYILEKREEISLHTYKKPPVKTDFQRRMSLNSDGYIYNHRIKYPMEKVQERIKHVKQGGNWRQVPEELWDTIRYNRHSSAYRRLNEREPSITIDTGHMNYFHPIFHRVPTVRESARIQSFPDEFIFVGPIGAQYRQVGNAVPPILACKIAQTLKKGLISE